MIPWRTELPQYGWKKKKTLQPVQQHLFKILFKGYYRDKYTSFFNCFLTICTVLVLSIHILRCASLMFCCHTNRCKLKTICGAQCIEKVHFSKGLDNWSGVCYVKVCERARYFKNVRSDGCWSSYVWWSWWDVGHTVHTCCTPQVLQKPEHIALSSFIPPHLRENWRVKEKFCTWWVFLGRLGGDNVTAGDYY